MKYNRQEINVYPNRLSFLSTEIIMIKNMFLCNGRNGKNLSKSENIDEKYKL